MTRDPGLDAVTTCPRCLQYREITGVGDALFWVCACGPTPVDAD